jgi:uracil-DNA glycosylase
MRLLKNLRVVVCLGHIAFDGLLSWAQRKGMIASRREFTFAHGAEFTVANGLKVIASYHPSLQNTNTGRLTRAMFLDVFTRARRLAQARASDSK